MILGGFTRICVNIHHPALAASFRDVARLKRTEQGRVALGVTPPKLPQIRACRLPAPASSSHEVATSAIRRRYVDMDQVSMYLACFPSTVPETAPPSFHGVPRVGSPASTVLWGAATPCRPFRHASFPSLGRYQPGVPGSSPSALDAGPWIILELFIRSSLRLLVVETAGSPKFPEEPL